MGDERLGKLLRDVRLPEEEAAEERGLRVAMAAYGRRKAVPGRRVRPRLALALAGGLLALALLLSPAGAKVRDWIADVVETGMQDAKPALTKLPGGGELLVESPAGVSIVHADGTRRSLGAYQEGTWSPRGRFVAVARGRTLSAVDPLGNIRWSLSRPRPIAHPRWSPYPGFRVAYLAGDSLRVVAGDGTGDGLLAPQVLPVAPAWRPGPRHVLAYVGSGGSVRVVATDSGRRLAGLAPAVGPVRQLQWTADGRGLLVVGTRAVALIDLAGHTLAHVPAAAGTRVGEAAIAPQGRRFAIVFSSGDGSGNGRSRAVIATQGDPVPVRAVFSGPGRFTDLVWSPNAQRILVAWRDADQWLFIPATGRGKVIAVGNIARQFDPGTTSTPRFPRVEGWCCSS